VLEQEKTLNRQLKQEIDRRQALEDQLRTMAETDPLTSVFNRRYFTGTAEREAKKALRYGEDLSLMILDLDHFKQVNDRFGHSRGDDVLQTVVQVIQNELREVDVLARLGGEEFGILLPNTNLEAAHTAAERIRRAIEHYEHPLPSQYRSVTVSIGVAQLRESDEGLDKLYKRTDDALYSAKEHGRNRTAVASA
jgi:diguanylate cyclase (GGDEF)-like protein